MYEFAFMHHFLFGFTRFMQIIYEFTDYSIICFITISIHVLFTFHVLSTEVATPFEVDVF